MRRRFLGFAASCAALLAVALPLAAHAALPTPDPNFLTTILPSPCTAQANNTYEAAQFKEEGWKAPSFERYPGSCTRMRFSFGPIVVKPGQNDVLIQPITIEKPSQDGYITRFAPDLVYQDGTIPPIEQLHLHHAVWLSQPSYGLGPFAASGEEKTIFNFPRGFGMPIKATDQWQLLYMVHSAIPQPKTVFITYEVDFVPTAKAADAGLKPAYPVWLDVRPGTYPVFNVQRGFGTKGTCTWPRQQCAAFDPYGEKVAGQGMPANRAGTDVDLPAPGQRLGTFPNFQGGTLILAGGHLHPGGIANEIDLVRDDKVKRIYTSEARYWDRADHSKWGGPPTSWDFSITVARPPYWGVHVEPGDTLRSNATYDTTVQSTYEDMGIVVAILAPDIDGKPTASGVNPFTAPVDTRSGCPSGGLKAAVPTLCDKGTITHGHLKENDNFGGASGGLEAARGQVTDRVDIGAFVYLPGDLSMLAMTGLPTVKLGTQLKFFNEDAALDIYHSATSCAYPCTGPTGTAFPLANGRTSAGRSLDFDSNELGFGIPTLGPAKNAADWTLPITPEHGYKAGEVITYYCRIHPSMRGAFEVQA